MPTIKNKRQLAAEADTLAQSFNCVQYKGELYLPADYETLDWRVPAPPNRRFWIPVSRSRLVSIAREQFDTVFVNDTEVGDFMFMVLQSATQHDIDSDKLLIITNEGLYVLHEDGALHPPTGDFVPNMVPVKLNTDEQAKTEVRNVISGWLNSEEEATHLLRHLATTLAPGWSAVKYVLLLGDGRNGKSVMMLMLMHLFGRHNVSGVTRQDISEKSPVVTELNGKLLNIVFDGMASYLKDSGHEKSLIAGEEIGVRMLYRSTLTRVQTNALFVEGLNREPKSSDKSSALQERLVRFWFKNTYEDDLVFQQHMLSDEMLGALLAVLLDNYVCKENKSVMLAPTEASKELKMQHMVSNSLALQFLEHLMETGDPMDLIGSTETDLVDAFKVWRLRDGDMSVWTKDNVRTLFKPVLELGRKSKRTGTKVVKVVVITGFKKAALDLIESDTHSEEADDAVVAD